MPIHHVCLNVRDMDEAAAWYTAALKPLGYKVAMELADGEVKGFRSGRWCGPDMWLAGPRAPTADGSDTRHSPTAPAVEGGGDSVKRQPTGDCHLAFKACNRAQVRAFHEAALCVSPLLLLVLTDDGTERLEEPATASLASARSTLQPTTPPLSRTPRGATSRPPAQTRPCWPSRPACGFSLVSPLPCSVLLLRGSAGVSSWAPQLKKP